MWASLVPMHDDQDYSTVKLQLCKKNRSFFVSKYSIQKRKFKVREHWVFVQVSETKRLPRLIDSKVSRFIASAHFVALCKLFVSCFCTRSIETKEFNGGKRGGVEWDIMWDSSQQALADRDRFITQIPCEHMNSLQPHSAVARYSDRERRLVGREWKRTAKNFRNFQFFLSAHSTSRFRHRCKSTGGNIIFLLQLFLFFWTFLMVHILMHACLVWSSCCC